MKSKWFKNNDVHLHPYAFASDIAGIKGAILNPIGRVFQSADFLYLWKNKMKIIMWYKNIGYGFLLQGLSKKNAKYNDI